MQKPIVNVRDNILRAVWLNEDGDIPCYDIESDEIINGGKAGTGFIANVNLQISSYGFVATGHTIMNVTKDDVIGKFLPE